MASEEMDYLVDLEFGGTTSEGGRESISYNSRGKMTFSRSNGGALSCNGSISGDSIPDSSESLLKSSSNSCGRVELFVEGSLGGKEARDLVSMMEKKNVREHCKKSNFNKAAKPPRPPKGPSLNASDLKLVMEISELAARKRARVERMKALRKMKETKRQSSNGSIIALVISIFFLLVILFQGLFTQNDVDKEFHGSPAPAMVSDGLISIHLFDNAPANKQNGPVSQSLNSEEQIYSLSPGEEEGRDIG